MRTARWTALDAGPRGKETILEHLRDAGQGDACGGNDLLAG
jgi:hypothetical protein